MFQSTSADRLRIGSPSAPPTPLKKRKMKLFLHASTRSGETSPSCQRLRVAVAIHSKAFSLSGFTPVQMKKLDSTCRAKCVGSPPSVFFPSLFTNMQTAHLLPTPGLNHRLDNAVKYLPSGICLRKRLPPSSPPTPPPLSVLSLFGDELRSAKTG